MGERRRRQTGFSHGLLTAAAADVRVGCGHEVATTAQRVRDDRRRAFEFASMTAELEGQRLIVVTENVLYYDYKGPVAPIGDLRTADGEPLTIADANGAYIWHKYNGDLTVIYLHTDWKAAGFIKPGAPRSGAMTEEEKVERRTVIENNRAWDAAQTVRVEFIKTLLQSKKTPKDALRFISDSMGGHSHTVADGLSKHHEFAAELLGDSDNYGERASITAKPSTRPKINMLTIVLGGFEKSLLPPVMASALTDGKVLSESAG